MKRLGLVLLTSCICFASFAQRKRSIELSFLGRYDQHADYVSNFAGRAFNDTNKLYGTSFGINGVFRKQVANKSFMYVGLGFYQLRVDKIKGSMPFNIPGTRTARNIDYDDGMTNLLYSTSQYHYNNLAITIGFDREFQLKRNFKFDLAAELIGYKSFAQKYKLMNGADYFTNNPKPFEFGINLQPGFVKEYRKFYLKPALLIPVFQTIKGDKVFYEDPQMNISKWFSGVGLSFKIGKYL